MIAREADSYLEKRAEQGFNVIQAVALAELDGLNTPNPYGHVPLKDNDPAQPNEAYFEHVDYIIRKADELGLYIALLPTWGDKLNTKSWELALKFLLPKMLSYSANGSGLDIKNMIMSYG